MMKKVDNDIMGSTDPMQVLTTNKQDYVRHNVGPRAFHNPDKYVQPAGEIDLTSSYAREYLYKYQDKVKPIRHERPKAVLADFEGITTQKFDYPKWSVGRTESFGPQRRYERPAEFFDGASTYNNDFHTHQQQVPRNLIKPVTNTGFSDEPFYDMTSNRRDFTRHPLPEKNVKPTVEYAPNKIPLDDMTTSKMDYGAKVSIYEIKSFKPRNDGLRSEEPFLGSTTQKDDFKQWKVAPAISKKDNGYKAPLGEMDLNTNYSKDFVGVVTAPAKAIKPEPRKKNYARFEGQSTYLADFQSSPSNISRRGMIIGVSEYQMPNQPFEGSSTYKSEFYGTRGDAAKTYKPSIVHSKPTDPFVADTSYRSEYVKKSKYVE